MQRRRILDAARRELTEKGYDAATVAGIAAAADVARQVVYDTVGDKEALLAALADEVADELVAALDARFSTPESIDRPLADLVRDDVLWFMDLIQGDPAIVAIVHTSGRVGGAAAATARARRRLEDRITRLHVDRARAYGIERGEAARLLAVVMLSLTEAVAFRAAAEDGWPVPAAAALVAEFATGGYGRVEGVGAPVTEAFDADARPAPPAGDG